MPTTILIIDDDPIARRVLETTIKTEALLKEQEARVVQASGGKKGLTLAEADPPALIIVDLFMPGMDGFAFCRALRATGWGQAIPLLVISGVYKDPVLTDQLAADFAAKFLAKPIVSHDLAEAILDLLRRRFRPTMAEAEPMAVPLPPPIDIPLPMPVLADAEEPDLGNAASGDLAAIGVPRLLLELLENQATGTLVVTYAQSRKEIYFRNGEAVSAESNLRQEALGSLLVAKKVIDESQLAYLLTEAKQRSQKLGALMVELGWLSPEEVLNFLTAQARKRIVDCLRWTSGTWTFEPGDEFGERVIEHSLETERLVFVGLQRTASPETLLERLDRDGHRPIRLTASLERHRNAFEATFGPQLIPLLGQSPTLGDLILRPDAESLILGIEALLIAGLAELDTSVEESVPRPHPDPADSFSLEKLGSELSRPPSLPNLEAVDDLFNEGGHPFITDIPARDAGVPVVVASSEDSGVVALGTSSRAITPGQSSAEMFPSAARSRSMLSVEGEAHRALLLEYLEIHGKSLHRVLDIHLTSSPEEIEAAFASKMSRVADELFDGIDLGPDQSKLQAVRAAYQRAYRVLADPDLRRDYEAALEPRAPEVDPLGAELAFGEGLSLLAAGEPLEAIGKFHAAVQARPDQAAYHAYLGWSQFLAESDPTVDQARESIAYALQLNPDLAEAHEFLGRIAAGEGDDEAARVHLEHSLELEPAKPEALELLVRVYSRARDLRSTERIYRRVIAGLGERSLPLRLRLWKELADLYEGELGDRSSARIAYEMAARLAPDDLAIQRKVVMLNAEDLHRWREIARALAAEWRLRPDDRDVGGALVDLFLRVGRHDAATVAASALLLRGLANEETKRLAEQHRPRLLTRLPAALDDSVLTRLGFAAEDIDLEALFSELAAAGVLVPFSGEDLGLSDEEPLSEEKQPATFRRVMEYVCRILDVPEPTAIYCHPDLSWDARMADTRPYALLVGPALLETADTVELGFRLGRALSLATPGRIAGSSRTGRQLRPYLLACLAMSRGAATSDDAEVEATRLAIVNVGPGLRARVAELAGRLCRSRSSINLSAWSRMLNGTATRVGLLLSGDLIRVGRSVAEEEGQPALDALLDFALAPEHLDLREELGLSPVV